LRDRAMVAMLIGCAAANAATWRGVMQVGLIRFHGAPLPPTKASDRIKCQKFSSTASVWRYAPSLAGSAEIGRSADYQLGCSDSREIIDGGDR
jgi:hypothetical protein